MPTARARRMLWLVVSPRAASWSAMRSMLASNQMAFGVSVRM
jgi:hypothetical protein